MKGGEMSSSEAKPPPRPETADNHGSFLFISVAILSLPTYVCQTIQLWYCVDSFLQLLPHTDAFGGEGGFSRCFASEFPYRAPATAKIRNEIS